MSINEERRRFLTTAALTLMLGTTKSLLHGTESPSDRGLAALRKANAWLNSPPLTADGLRGKVVVVDFCTYTCVNWLRTLPYLRAWDAKYRDHGLVTIGAHTPEFAFEHDLDNVRRAIKAIRVNYPIAVDNDYGIWNGFSNQYWPALYLLDGKGKIRFTHFGEGAYDESERMIQQVLGDAGASGFNREMVSVDARGLEVPADWENVRSGETYLGSDQADHRNEWSLAGDWSVGSKAIVLKQSHGKILYRFHARDVNLVMGPAARGTTVRFRVSIDGRATGGGGDVDTQGQSVVNEQRTYQLIRQARPITDRQFEIEFLDAGVEAFCFTFG